jgi:hypothetical protein
MSQGSVPDEEIVAAMIVDDVTELLKKGRAKQRTLLEYESRWLGAGASPETCKVVRLLASTLGARIEGRADALTDVLPALPKAIQLSRETFTDPSADARPPSGAPEAAAGTDRAPLALIMKGGGIKGLAYVGALEQLSRRYRFDWYVGTSAGAVAAVLLGAGYSVDQLKDILKSKDFRDFFDASWWRKWVNLAVHHGMHPADSFTSWLDTLLAEKLRKASRVRLSDLPYRVTVYASRRNKRAIRFDSRDNDADAAYAVRCSMSIPLVFTPQSEQGLRTYDGGLQHNYPVTDLLSNYPGTPFMSLFIGPEVYEPIRQRWVLLDLISIWTEAGDAEALTEYRDRTVIIDPRPVGTLDFDLTDEEKEFLLACGRVGALAHLSNDTGAYADAKRIRDGLKSKIEAARRAKRLNRRVWRYVALVALYVLISILAWYFRIW